MNQRPPSAAALVPCSSSPSPLPSTPPPLLSILPLLLSILPPLLVFSNSSPHSHPPSSVQVFLEQLLLQMPELVNQADPMQDFLIGMLF